MPFVKGYKQTPEHTERIRKALTGRKLSAEHIKNCSAFHQVGPKHPKWKGGITLCADYDRLYHKEYRKRQGKLYTKWLNHRRRQRVRAGGPLSYSIIRTVYDLNVKKYGVLTCYLCLRPITRNDDELDHKIPVSLSGKNEFENLEIACRRCNRRKYTKTVEQYREWLNKNAQN